jgi:hypothetical protein
MDREILFKGCTVLGNRWIKGIYIPFTDKQFGYIIDRVTGEQILCYNKSIGQYTGFTDKNGENIFEGDIMQLCSACYPCLVYWDGKGWAWKQNGKRREIDLTREKMCIIGNLYDNPELLRSENG